MQFSTIIRETAYNRITSLCCPRCDLSYR